ncbi:MAG: antiterminator LoaP [Erysipelotrichaceae bacterium]|nr:antiterminator LoaP [Erysipelotrichaceae bacterium]
MKLTMERIPKPSKDTFVANWYVIRVKTNDEENVRNLLVRHGFETKILTREFYRKKNGSVDITSRMLFPGYLFVISEMEYREFDAFISTIKYKYGHYMINLKNDNEGTAALTESEIRWIEKLTGSKDVVEKSTGIIEGDRVIITEGPLFGLESNITYINRHKHIARLTMDFLGEEREVEVPLEIVSKR